MIFPVFTKKEIVMPIPTQVVFAWCDDIAMRDQAVALFMDNISPSYISHSELQYGRADTPQQWRHDLREQLHATVSQAIDTTPDHDHLAMAIATIDGALVAIALVEIDMGKQSSKPYATLDDMIVSPAYRSHGIGQQLLDWLSIQLKARGIQRLFLESGIGNSKAHHFFNKQGFDTISVVMMKTLS